MDLEKDFSQNYFLCALYALCGKIRCALLGSAVYCADNFKVTTTGR
jgi:hypothetical protein